MRKPTAGLSDVILVYNKAFLGFYLYLIKKKGNRFFPQLKRVYLETKKK